MRYHTDPPPIARIRIKKRMKVARFIALVYGKGDKES
jgi:hypothetical protein